MKGHNKWKLEDAIRKDHPSFEPNSKNWDQFYKGAEWATERNVKAEATHVPSYAELRTAINTLKEGGVTVIEQNAMWLLEKLEEILAENK